MADESLIDKVHDLSDLELAALLSLIAREHCLISTPPAGLDDLVEELQLVRTPTTTLQMARANGIPGSQEDIWPHMRRCRLHPFDHP